MGYKEELHEEINQWDLYTVEKMTLEEAILKIFSKEKQRIEQLVDKLKRYGFKDEEGHPLEKCVDFKELTL